MAMKEWFKRLTSSQKFVIVLFLVVAVMAVTTYVLQSGVRQATVETDASVNDSVTMGISGENEQLPDFRIPEEATESEVDTLLYDYYESL